MLFLYLVSSLRSQINERGVNFIFKALSRSKTIAVLGFEGQIAPNFFKNPVQLLDQAILVSCKNPYNFIKTSFYSLKQRLILGYCHLLSLFNILI